MDGVLTLDFLALRGPKKNEHINVERSISNTSFSGEKHVICNSANWR